VAKLLLEGDDEIDIRRTILDDNLFQTNSPATTRKYLNMIFPRLHNLTEQQLRFVAHGDQELVQMTLLYAVLKTSRLIIDFLHDVIAEKLQRFDRELTKLDWMVFLEERSQIESGIGEWSETSKKKIGQVVFRILHEAGYLTETRSPEIICPLIPFELEDCLQDSEDEKYLKLMELRAH